MDVVNDQTGAVIPGATVTITDPKTKDFSNCPKRQWRRIPIQQSTRRHLRHNRPAAADSNFSTLTLSDVRVKLNEVTDVPTVLQPGEATASVTVSAGGAELVDTTSLNLRKISTRDRSWIWPKPGGRRHLQSRADFSKRCQQRRCWSRHRRFSRRSTTT